MHQMYKRSNYMVSEGLVQELHKSIERVLAERKQCEYEILVNILRQDFDISIMPDWLIAREIERLKADGSITITLSWKHSTKK